MDWKETTWPPNRYVPRPMSETWRSMDHIAWVSDGSAAPPVLCRKWQRLETGEVEWRPLETVIWKRPDAALTPPR